MFLAELFDCLKAYPKLSKCLDISMRCKTKQQALRMISAVMKTTNLREHVAKSYIAYWSGYFEPEVRDRIEDLFDCEHPIFGKKRLSPIECFCLGMEHGKLFNLRN